MFGMLGFIPDLREVDLEETVEKPAPTIVSGDIVEVATRYGKAVLATCKDYDTVAHLRVLGQCQGDRMIYVMLVTGGDVKHILPSGRVDKRLSREYNIDGRFFGEESVIVTDLHVRGLVKEQRGRYCEKCDEYNEDVRTDYSEVYFCGTCRENPWR